MEERLQKILSQAGVASRREAERMITDGRVAVNGVRSPNWVPRPTLRDTITVDGKPVTVDEKRVYVLSINRWAMSPP